jgi:hypothetical protein
VSQQSLKTGPILYHDYVGSKKSVVAKHAAAFDKGLELLRVATAVWVGVPRRPTERRFEIDTCIPRGQAEHGSGLASAHWLACY